MGRCRLYYDLVSSALGVLLSASAFIVFIWVYRNTHAGTWAGLSGIFSGLCLHLHVTHWLGRLESHFNPRKLNALEILAFIFLLIGCAVSLWYIFAMLYWHKPVMPVKESYVINTVWTLILAKWSLVLFFSSRRYSSMLSNDFQPIHNSI